MDAAPFDPQVVEQQFVESLEVCGLKRNGITVMFDADIQVYWIDIALSAEASTNQIECMHNAIGLEPIRFEDGGVAAAYDQHVQDVMRPTLRAQNETYLRDRGLLEAAPTIETAASLQELAKQMEELCGFESGSMFTVTGDQLTLGGEGSSLIDADYEQAGCLLALIRYSGVKNFGFIGNEKVQVEDE